MSILLTVCAACALRSTTWIPVVGATGRVSLPVPKSQQDWQLTGAAWAWTEEAIKATAAQRFVNGLPALVGTGGAGAATTPEFLVTPAMKSIDFSLVADSGVDDCRAWLKIDGRTMYEAGATTRATLTGLHWDLTKFVGKTAKFGLDKAAARWVAYVPVGVEEFSKAANYHLARTLRSTKLLRLQDTAINFKGRIVFPMPPTDTCQEVLSCNMVASDGARTYRAEVESDKSALPKQVLAIDIPTPQNLTVTVTVKVRFYDTRLERGPSKSTIPTLSEAERKYYTDPHWTRPDMAQWFREATSKVGMHRNAEESDLAFALRALVFVGKEFHYYDPAKDPVFRPESNQLGDLGDLQFHWRIRAGECWRLSSVYANILRQAGIPVRTVSGNWVIGDYGHHLRDIVWIDGLGWVPVEPTSSTNSGDGKGTTKFFGVWGGDFLAGNESIDYHVLWGQQTFNVGTFDSLWFLTDDGKFSITKNKMAIVGNG